MKSNTTPDMGPKNESPVGAATRRGPNSRSRAEAKEPVQDARRQIEGDGVALKKVGYYWVLFALSQ